MTEIHFDIETKSSVDLAKQGLYKYVESPDFDVLLLSYSIDNEKIQAIDLANGEAIPAFLIDALTNPKIRKIAHNASFERVCMSVYLRKSHLLGSPEGWYSDGKFLTPKGWYCTMIQAAEAGLPMSLKAVGEALGLTEQKDTEGANLIKMFSILQKDGSFHKPSDFPEEWKRFVKYNIQDVVVEMAIYHALQKLPISEYELNNYITDQMINDYGIHIDTQLVQNAIAMNAKFREQALQRAKEISGLSNPNSPLQVLNWLEEQGVKSASLDKEAVAELLQTTNGSVKEMLLLRQQLSKSSVKKYEAMQKVAASDDRARGLIQFYGATKTGRYCLAEGTPVLVKDRTGNISEKPIETVTTDDMVFDGNEWVSHDGVVFSGEHEVITWDGITGTENQMVFINENMKISLGEAKAERIPLWRGMKQNENL